MHFCCSLQNRLYFGVMQEDFVLPSISCNSSSHEGKALQREFRSCEGCVDLSTCHCHWLGKFGKFLVI